MSGIAKVYTNCYGEFYEHGRPFSDAGWTSITDSYEKELEANGRCTVTWLAERALISTHSACKVIDFYESGIDIPCREYWGHGHSGVRSILGWEMYHHAFW